MLTLFFKVLKEKKEHRNFHLLTNSNSGKYARTLNNKHKLHVCVCFFNDSWNGDFLHLCLMLVLFLLQMSSNQVEQDLEMLLSMEIKIRLLETEGMQIPTEAPPRPRLPENYDFAFMKLWWQLQNCTCVY